MPGNYDWVRRLIKESAETETLINARTLRERGLFESLTPEEAENPDNWIKI